MPRPRKSRDASRVSRINLRFTPDEGAHVRAAAKAAGKTPTAFACHAVLVSVDLAARQVQRDTICLEPAAVAALNRIGANLRTYP